MTTPPRVLLLLSSLHGGGAERVAAHLANRCDPNVVDVRLGLLRRAGPFLGEVEPSRILKSRRFENLLVYEGHNSSFYRPDRLLAAATLAPLKVRGMIRDFRPQVVMSFLKGMGLLAWAVNGSLPRRERPRFILREGNNTDAVIEDELSSEAARRFIKALTRRAYRGADAFLANSWEMAHGLQERLALEPSRLRVIHNPIDLAAIKAKAKAPAKGAPSGPFILTVGRLEHQKAHDALLPIFAASEAAKGMSLVIVGRGSREAALKQQAADLGIADRVIFPGFIDNPWSWMARCALFVLPSRWEGFPTVLAEALACGAPVLATACDFGPAELLEHDVSGWVVPAFDDAAFAGAMERLLTDRDLRCRLAAAGPARAAEFDLSAMIENYTRLFLEQAMLSPVRL